MHAEEQTRRDSHEDRLYGHAGFRRALAGGCWLPPGTRSCGVFSQPDKPKNRGMKLQPTPVKAVRHGP